MIRPSRRVRAGELIGYKLPGVMRFLKDLVLYSLISLPVWPLADVIINHHYAFNSAENWRDIFITTYASLSGALWGLRLSRLYE
jgi:hypothetical protein